MNENHIIKFDHDKLIISDIIIRNYTVYNGIYINKGIINYYINIRCYYNNLFINSDYIFNLSNMLYKLHTPDYYSKIHRNKVLI